MVYFVTIISDIKLLIYLFFGDFGNYMKIETKTVWEVFSKTILKNIFKKMFYDVL